MTSNCNPAALAYIDSIIKKHQGSVDEIKIAMYNLKLLNESAFNYVAKISYSFQLPVDVCFLLFDLVLNQVKFGDNPNVQKILQNLSRNQKQQYEYVFPEYSKVMETYIQKEKEILSGEYKPPVTKEDDDDEYSYFRNKRPATFFKSTAENYVINPARIPKQGWLINIYAETYEKYCEIVTATMNEFKDKNFTIFLCIPEVFEKNIKKKSPQIAFSIFANEHFNFTSLSNDALTILDSGDNLKFSQNEIIIGGRTTLSMKLFDSKKYLLDKKVSDKNSELLLTYSDADQVFDFIEKLGAPKTTREYYTEIMTGLPSDSNEPYKPIIFYFEDIEEMNDILDEIDKDNLDFIVDADHDEIKILFVHHSHYDKIIKEISEYDIDIIENPKL
jgi:hypothetical protein